MLMTYVNGICVGASFLSHVFIFLTLGGCLFDDKLFRDKLFSLCIGVIYPINNV